MNQIYNNLYISDWFSSNNTQLLRQNNIKAVITIETQQKPLSVLHFYKANDIEFLYLFLPDSPDADISKYFDQSFNFINSNIKRNRNVLIHCWAGISRSPTLALNYILRKSEYNTLTCMSCLVKYVTEKAKQNRPIINPNIGFYQQLLTVAEKYKRNSIILQQS